MSTSLITQLRSGKDRGWEEMYNMLATDLRGYISRLGSHEPDDILGETMAHLVRDIHSFRGSDEELRPWAFRIARNRVIDAARRRQSRATEVPNDALINETAAVIPLVELPDTEEIDELLSLLTEDQKTVIWLRFVADMSISETAMLVGRTPEAVAALTHRGIRTLRDSIAA